MEEPYLKEFKEKAAGRVLTRLYVRTNHRKTKVPEGQVLF